jgi:hypothetical protein
VTRGFSRSCNQADQVPSSKVTCTSPRTSDYADCGRHASTSQPQSPLSIRHNQEVGMFLVHIHADIFSAVSHKRVFLSGWFEGKHPNLTP